MGYLGNACELTYCKDDCNGNGGCLSGICTCNTGWSDQSCSTKTLVKNCPRCANFTGHEDCNGNECVNLQGEFYISTGNEGEYGGGHNNEGHDGGSGNGE